MPDAIFMALGFEGPGVWLAIIVGAATVVLGAWWRGRKSGDGARADDALDRMDEGRKAVLESRASNKTPDERVRDNDGAWK